MPKPIKKLDYLESPWKMFRFAISPYKGRFWFMCALVLIGNSLANSLPYFFKLIADSVAAHGTKVSFHDLLVPVALVGAVLLASEIMYRAGHVIETYTAPEAFSRVTNTVYGGLIKRPTSYFEDKFSGDLGRRIEQVASSTLYFIQDFPWGVGWIIATTLTTGILLAFTNIWIVLTFVVWLILFLATAIPLIIMHRKRSEELASSHARLSGNIIDAIGNAPLIHSFGGMSHEQELNQRNIDTVIEVERRVRWAFIWNKFQQGMSVTFLALSLAIVSAVLFSRGVFTLGDFVIVSSAVPLMIGVVWNLGEIILRASRESGQFADALQQLRDKQEQLSEGEATANRIKEYQISFEKIFFQYPGTKRAVFDGFSLEIKEGERVGIVGSSGAGKSTLIKLLLRQHSAKKGIIAIGKTPIQDFSLDAFNRLISYVPQDTSLFHRSLFDNIHYANPEASREAVLRASEKAHADEFIQALPEKYETKVGERGVKLSGGQRQRIALARAILKDAPILILDEATSSLDSESESAVQESIAELFHGRTVIAIAHRLSTLRVMDRIVVIENGQIKESGSPQDLLAHEASIFKKMWEHQKNGFV
jgi:ATP-binding cassette subfamily B protein